jgi:hypothetical protein
VSYNRINDCNQFAFLMFESELNSISHTILSRGEGRRVNVIQEKRDEHVVDIYIKFKGIYARA